MLSPLNKKQGITFVAIKHKRTEEHARGFKNTNVHFNFLVIWLTCLCEENDFQSAKEQLFVTESTVK